MESATLITSISLITAFFGGMVALFAPCCITFLLPSYLANIFRAREKVVGMTLIFGSGIATVLVPTALGIRAIGQVFQDFHTQTYVVGGALMILLGVMELTGRKITLPMLHLTIDLNKRHDPWSVYLLGIFSGLTSSCCTPVLVGILTLSFLSPNFVWAGLAGLSYVFGMVVPLVVLALLLDRVNWTAKLPQLRGKVVGIAGKKVLVTDAVAGVLFIFVGITFTILALSGRITMGVEQPIEQSLGFTWNLVRYLRTLPAAEYLFAIALLAIFVILVKKSFKKERRKL